MPEITAEHLEELGQISDSLDNLLGAMELKMPDFFHVQQLKNHLPELRDRIRAAIIPSLQENPWETPDRCELDG